MQGYVRYRKQEEVSGKRNQKSEPELAELFMSMGYLN
jgi:hypothetical protein